MLKNKAMEQEKKEFPELESRNKPNFSLRTQI